MADARAAAPAMAAPADALARHAAGRRAMFYLKSDIALDDAVLRSLARPDPAALEANAVHARAMLARTLGLAPADASVEALPQQGTFHHVFAGDGCIVRVNRLAQHFVDWQLLADERVAPVLEEHGIAHAKVLGVDCSRSRMPTDAEVLERLEGDSLSACDEDDAAIAPWLGRLARRLREVHAIRGTGYGFIDVSVPPRLAGVHRGWDDYIFTRLADHLAALRAAGVMSAGEVRRSNDAFEAARAALARVEPRLLHGDTGNHNVIVRDGEAPRLIDWEDALLGDPLFDVAFWATFHPERRWPVFFESYFNGAWEPTRRFWLYFLRVALSKTVHRLRFGYADKPGRPPAAARIQRALAGLEATAGEAP